MLADALRQRLVAGPKLHALQPDGAATLYLIGVVPAHPGKAVHHVHQRDVLRAGRLLPAAGQLALELLEESLDDPGHLVELVGADHRRLRAHHQVGALRVGLELAVERLEGRVLAPVLGPRLEDLADRPRRPRLGHDLIEQRHLFRNRQQLAAGDVGVDMLPVERAGVGGHVLAGGRHQRILALELVVDGQQVGVGTDDRRTRLVRRPLPELRVDRRARSARDQLGKTVRGQHGNVGGQKRGLLVVLGDAGAHTLDVAVEGAGRAVVLLLQHVEAGLHLVGRGEHLAENVEHLGRIYDDAHEGAVVARVRAVLVEGLHRQDVAARLQPGFKVEDLLGRTNVAEQVVGQGPLAGALERQDQLQPLGAGDRRRRLVEHVVDVTQLVGSARRQHPHRAGVAILNALPEHIVVGRAAQHPVHVVHRPAVVAEGLDHGRRHPQRTGRVRVLKQIVQGLRAKPPRPRPGPVQVHEFLVLLGEGAVDEQVGERLLELGAGLRLLLRKQQVARQRQPGVADAVGYLGGAEHHLHVLVVRRPQQRRDPLVGGDVAATLLRRLERDPQHVHRRRLRRQLLVQDLVNLQEVAVGQ
ncbi:MAG: hypothetical protein BWZ02_00970 [Lentisphaerae bacterium ADurb.BinA184]|nr:MAG: hypothetical protein BWZ02_00970 [Lentisphaerae bacterium ADurb.BinA184]